MWMQGPLCIDVVRTRLPTKNKFADAVLSPPSLAQATPRTSHSSHTPFLCPYQPLPTSLRVFTIMVASSCRIEQGSGLCGRVGEREGGGRDSLDNMVGTLALSHSLTYSLTHPLTHPLTLALNFSPFHSLTHHVLARSLTQLTHPHPHSHTLTHTCSHSLALSPTRSLTYSLTPRLDMYTYVPPTSLLHCSVNWRSRWFRLTADELVYSQSETSKVCVGSESPGHAPPVTKPRPCEAAALLAVVHVAFEGADLLSPHWHPSLVTAVAIGIDSAGLGYSDRNG